MADLRIDLAAEFVGKKAFKDADNSAVRLDKTVKKLAKTLGLTLGASAMAAYGKAAVKAFSEDEAAVKRLAGAVDNLGLSFFKVDVEKFISVTESSAGILDDKLRPAMQALLTTTGSLVKSQELLNNAIQISRASGVDLATVSQDLANGFVGVTRGLRKYNTGLTQAELKSKSFNEILGIMLAKSAGAADEYLTTTAFKLDVLSVASANAQETIGKGLVDALAVLGGGSSAADAAKTIDSIAKGINGITMATAKAVNAIRQLYKGLDFITSLGGLTGGSGLLVQRFGDEAAPTSTNRSASPAGTAARTRQARDAQAAAAKRAKEIANLQKKSIDIQKKLTAEQKKQNALKKAGTVFDLDQISLVAALKGKLSDADKDRVMAQLALLNGNEKVATELTNKILLAQDASGNLAKFLAALPNARNPFEYLEEYLKKLAATAAEMLGKATATNISPQAQTIVSQIDAATAQALAAAAAAEAEAERIRVINQNLTNAGLYFGAFPRSNPGDFRSAEERSNMTGPIQVNLQISGTDGLTNEIAKSLQNQSLSTGQTTTINRRTGGF